MVGFGRNFSVRIRRARRSESSRFSCSLAPAMPRIQLRSAPAENAAPSPVSTTARTAASAPACASAAVSVGDQCIVERVVDCGRFRVSHGDRAAAFAARMESVIGVPAEQPPMISGSPGTGWIARDGTQPACSGQSAGKVAYNANNSYLRGRLCVCPTCPREPPAVVDRVRRCACGATRLRSACAIWASSTANRCGGGDGADGRRSGADPDRYTRFALRRAEAARVGVRTEEAA